MSAVVEVADPVTGEHVIVSPGQTAPATTAPAKVKAVYTAQQQANRAARKVARSQLRAEGIASPTRAQVAEKVRQNRAVQRAVTAGKLPVPETETQRKLRLRIEASGLSLTEAATLMKVPLAELKRVLGGGEPQPPHLDIEVRASWNLPKAPPVTNPPRPQRTEEERQRDRDLLASDWGDELFGDLGYDDYNGPEWRTGDFGFTVGGHPIGGFIGTGGRW